MPCHTTWQEDSSFTYLPQEWGNGPIGWFEEGNNYRHGNGGQDSITKENCQGRMEPGYFSWVDLIADAPKKWCHGIARFTLLRWAVNRDDDVWLTLRDTRHKHLCAVCLRPGDIFPGGFYTEAM